MRENWPISLSVNETNNDITKCNSVDSDLIVLKIEIATKLRMAQLYLNVTKLSMTLMISKVT